VALHEEGLIYRDKRLVNWDPKFHTAISDLEVEPRESDGHLWHFRYPIEGRDGKFITVATTRPETMLGDTAVAVHPEDERWQDLIGGHAVLPLVGRRLIIVADAYADPEQGSGAVKITPAHDFNDFEVGRRHDLELINIFDADASLNDNVPEAYRGLDRYVARKKVVADMEALGLVEKIEPHRHALPHGDRSGVVVEPWLTDQWFADAATLAKPAIEAVETGRIKFVPKQWENTYFEWMRNIQPWCISRQLWWGHRIPAWYGPDQTIFVAMDEAAAHEKAAAHYGEAVELIQDSDVLDTWFSSGLWPFSTLGWPEKTEALDTYYPNNDLITGFDIIFFWVARMIMLGMHFMDDVPFSTVYIHALVRDEQGQKMSKSKGNVIDPLELIDKYGADAIRFTLAAMEAQGRDIKLSESRVEGYRNFATKLWNAARFCEANGCARDEAFDPAGCNGTVNRWIVGEAARAATATAKALEDYRFNEAANSVYQFAWGIFCDWYLEFSKPVLNGPDGADKNETRATTAWVLEQILGLLHPFMPFVTEELWSRLEDDRPVPLISAPWPQLDDPALSYEDASTEIARVIALVTGVRAARAEMNVPAGAKIPLLLRDDSGLPDWAESQREQIVQLARLESMAALEGDPPKGSIQLVIDGASVALPLSGIIDVAQESARLEKELARIAQEIAKIEAKLGNEKFLAKAPEHVIAEQQRRKSEAEAACEKLKQALDRVAAL
jgi:valyl-tRNA synthetase